MGRRERRVAVQWRRCFVERRRWSLAGGRKRSFGRVTGVTFVREMLDGKEHSDGAEGEDEAGRSSGLGRRLGVVVDKMVCGRDACLRLGKRGIAVRKYRKLFGWVNAPSLAQDMNCVVLRQRGS